MSLWLACEPGQTAGVITPKSHCQEIPPAEFCDPLLLCSEMSGLKEVWWIENPSEGWAWECSTKACEADMAFIWPAACDEFGTTP